MEKHIVFYLAISFLFFCGCTSQDVSKEDFNIVLITIDTLRADHLSCYGYKRKTSPNIDKIAEKGIIFKNAIAPSSWTAPSMVSLFASTYPVNHGVIHGFGYIRTKKEMYQQEVFSDELTTMAEILKSHGYSTFGISSNHHLTAKFGFAKGFDHFKYLSYAPADHVNNIVYSWENKIKKSDKYFLWVHYIDPHRPYNPRSPWIEQYTPKADGSNLAKNSFASSKPLKEASQATLSNLVALYDSEINYVDFYAGELIQKLELDKNTLIIITADHGEEFLDHGFLDHGNNLHQETIHIPLIVKLPHSSENETVKKYVNLGDIMPSILDILAINPPKHTSGRSFWERKGTLFWLKKMFQRKEISEYTFAELDTKSILKTIISPEWKYIYNYQDKTEQLYDIKTDPLELNNLVDKETKRCNQLREKLFNWVSNSKKYPIKREAFRLSQKEKEKLEALGYLTTQKSKDYDNDGIPDNDDNCSDLFNPGQKDTCPPRGNGIGDACDCEGNFDCDQDVDGGDTTTLLEDLGRSEWYNPCTNENQCKGDFDCDGDVDGEDTTLFLEDLGRSVWHNPCPVCVVGDWCGY